MDITQRASLRETTPQPGISPTRRARPLRVAMVSPEIGPLAKSGGLADVVGGLSLALARLGVRLSLIMPAYRSVLQGDFRYQEREGGAFSVPISDRQETARVLEAELGENVTVYLVRADNYFDRDYLYATPDGDYLDNAERFVFFTRAALEIVRRNPPDILHCHDWQSALAIAFLKLQPGRYPELSPVKSVLSVHNLAYQGLFWGLDWHLLNLDRNLFGPGAFEFFGKINFLKAGLVFADKIIAVSPSYAEEIKTPEQGFGLEGIFQERPEKLLGILNGVDYGVWNPQSDPLIAKNYGPEDLSGKKLCKADLQRNVGLTPAPEVPLFGMVSRLTSQKGFDLLEPVLDELLRREIQFVLLGNGERQYDTMMSQIVSRYPGKAAFRVAFDEALAHRIEAGADLFLMPSQFEPCGLNQIYSLKYGTIPIVRATGGLKDTVRDCDLDPEGNGFVFGPYEPAALLDAAHRALKRFGDKRRWTDLMKRAMGADFSWDRSAKAYVELYRALVDQGREAR